MHQLVEIVHGIRLLDTNITGEMTVVNKTLIKLEGQTCAMRRTKPVDGYDNVFLITAMLIVCAKEMRLFLQTR